MRLLYQCNVAEDFLLGKAVKLLAITVTVLKLGVGVSFAWGSTRGQPFSKVSEFARLGAFLLVGLLPLGGFSSTDLVILSSSQTSRDVRFLRDLCGLALNI